MLFYCVLAQVSELAGEEALKAAISETSWIAVRFYSDSCVPCIFMRRRFENLDSLNPPARLSQLSCEVYHSACEAMGVRALPTLILFHDGKAISHYNFANEEFSWNDGSQMLRWIQTHMEKRTEDL